MLDRYRGLKEGTAAHAAALALLVAADWLSMVVDSSASANSLISSSVAGGSSSSESSSSSSSFALVVGGGGAEGAANRFPLPKGEENEGFAGPDAAEDNCIHNTERLYT